jgi:hypothetical protein
MPMGCDVVKFPFPEKTNPPNNKIPDGQGRGHLMKEWASSSKFINCGWIVPGGALAAQPSLPHYSQG